MCRTHVHEQVHVYAVNYKKGFLLSNMLIYQTFFYLFLDVWKWNQKELNLRSELKEYKAVIIIFEDVI